MADPSLFDMAAEVGSDEEEEELDEDGNPIERQRKSRKGGFDDSSEEEDEDDDEEAQRAVQEGFIVDEDEDEEERRARRKEKRKRRREEREEDEDLDEEDLDLIGVRDPAREPPKESKFKRLKRGHREDRSVSETRGVENIFSDDEEEGMGMGRRAAGGAFGNEMDDFIEEDEFPDEEQDRIRDEMEVRRPTRPGFADLQNLKESGLDEADLEDMRAAFGDGNEFEWALDVEDSNRDDLVDPEKPLELKDVFEPSQLVEKMLTDEDNLIRITDVPERFQLARKPYKDLNELSEDEQADRASEEANWIVALMWPKKDLDSEFRGPFRNAVANVLDFMNHRDYEVPFIFQHRKDYLIHSEQVPSTDPNGPAYDTKAQKLLNQDDLWEIFEMDLKFRAFVEKREAIQRTVQAIRDTSEEFSDKVFEDLIPSAETLEELQDIQDYLNFQYSAKLRDMSIVEAEEKGMQKRARGTRTLWDKVRSGNAYHLVQSFGISADALAENAEKSVPGRKNYTEDPDVRPIDMADTLIQDPEYRTGQEVLNAGRLMLVEEIAMSPRMRRVMRKIFYEKALFDVYRTDKGNKQIDEEHPYYEFKYLRGQEIRNFVQRPELFLKMVRAEQDGLVEVRVRLSNERRIKEDMQRHIESDNSSEVADAWNSIRREVVDLALKKLHRILGKQMKENIKDICERNIATACRLAYSGKLDQAPYKPKGMQLGTSPRVLALSNGAGQKGDAICWAYVDEHSKALENGKFDDLRLGNAEKYIEDGKDVRGFVELIERRKPDVVAISGFSVETRRLYRDLQEIVERFELKGTPYEEEVDGSDKEMADELEVVIVNDEVARLYHTSDRSLVDHPGTPPLTRYAIALAHYMQDPILQYASLGKDIGSISFNPNQHLIPQERLMKQLETAMVDMVNLVGVEVNDALTDQRVANLLPYVCGLGPRKAEQMVKVINNSGGEVITRDSLVGDPETGRKQALGPKIWENAASFLYIQFDETEPEADYLDNTRIHPEDYDIARKMAADTLELDEEDIKAEVDENGPNAILRRLVKEQAQDRVNDLLLEQYAEQLERQFQQKKRATLETIRAELQVPYEELRRNFTFLATDEVFTMLTGETRDSITEGMIIPVSVKRTFPDHIEVKLDCGIDGGISSTEYPESVGEGRLEPRQVWAQHQTIQAKLTFIDRKKFSAQLTLRENEMRNPFRRNYDHGLDEWDEEQEARDRKALRKVMEAKTGRAQRVIKHPLFRPFHSVQAEEFLGGQGRGDCVIRPSSKGLDHLAVTWKVHDGIYHHIDVLELDKENEFSVGRTLKVAGKWTYSDLDELIASHVKTMARKVDEMMADERYQKGSKEQTGKYNSTLDFQKDKFPC